MMKDEENENATKMKGEKRMRGAISLVRKQERRQNRLTHLFHSRRKMKKQTKMS